MQNPDNSFEYRKIGSKRIFFQFKDSNKNVFQVILNHIVLNKYECSVCFLENNEKVFNESYHSKTPKKDFGKIGDTVAAIFKNEILPLIEEKGIEITIKPLDEQRKIYFKKMIEKFIDTSKVKFEVNDKQHFIISKIEMHERKRLHKRGSNNN